MMLRNSKSRTSLRFVLMVVGLVVVTRGREVNAGFVTLDFAGQITSTTHFNSSLPTDVVVGQGYTGTLTYDDSVPAGSPGTENGQYYHVDAVIDLSVHIGSSTYSLQNTLAHYQEGAQQAVVVANDFPIQVNLLQDQFSAVGFSYDYLAATHHKYTVISLDLYEKSANPMGLSSNALAGFTFDLSKFTTFATISFVDSDINSQTGADNSRLEFVGSITSLQSQAVPEPARIVLLASGTLGLVGYEWRRRLLKRA